MLTILFSLFLFFLHRSTAQQECPVHYSCNNTQFANSEVENYCKRHFAHMIGRCCSLNNTVVGLDLRHCELKELNISLPEFSEIEILDLRDNDYDKLTSSDLVGLFKLNFLYLPEHMPCPGGSRCWNITSFVGNMTSCLYQLDPCSSLSISCGEPENAQCKHTGPGSAKCVCSENNSGYKCLVEGEFPAIAFGFSVLIPTIVLSIALWFIQGRDPYKKQHN